MADQFTRLRDGDRFWYKRDLSGADLRTVRSTSLADIVAANTTTTNLQDNVFFFDVKVSGRVFADANGNRRQDRGESGVAGVTLNLVDEDGAVVDAVTTDRGGNYRFAQVQIGDHTVVPVLPTGRRFTGRATADVDVTRGMSFSGVDFALASTSGRPSTSDPRRGQFGNRNQTVGRDQASEPASVLSSSHRQSRRLAEDLLA